MNEKTFKIPAINKSVCTDLRKHGQEGLFFPPPNHHPQGLRCVCVWVVVVVLAVKMEVTFCNVGVYK